MKIFYSAVFIILNLIALGQNKALPNNYEFKAKVCDSIIDFNIKLSLSELSLKETNFLLFDPDIKINEVLSTDDSFKFHRSNDTLLFSCSQKISVLDITYSIPWNRNNSNQSDVSKNIVVPKNKNQIFFERFYRWYPVVYDCFSEYSLQIEVPTNYHVFSPQIEDSLSIANNYKTLWFSIYDEDLPFLICDTTLLHHVKRENNNVEYDFYFNENSKRFLKFKESEPIFTTDSELVDSILNNFMDRVPIVYEWYQKNLWQKEIEKINVIESLSENAGGVGLRSMMFLTSRLMNHDFCIPYKVSHEIAHIWIGANTMYHLRGRYFMGESITEYVNLLCYEDLYGKSKFDHLYNLDFADFYSDIQVKFEDVLNARKGSDGVVNPDIIIYSKGPMFLHEFRKSIGKKKFLKIVRETYSEHPKLVQLSDFEECIKKNDCWQEYLALYELTL